MYPILVKRDKNELFLAFYLSFLSELFILSFLFSFFFSFLTEQDRRELHFDY